MNPLLNGCSFEFLLPEREAIYKHVLTKMYGGIPPKEVLENIYGGSPPDKKDWTFNDLEKIASNAKSEPGGLFIKTRKEFFEKYDWLLKGYLGLFPQTIDEIWKRYRDTLIVLPISISENLEKSYTGADYFFSNRYEKEFEKEIEGKYGPIRKEKPKISRDSLLGITVFQFYDRGSKTWKETIWDLRSSEIPFFKTEGYKKNQKRIR
jgi:hypothetical protein